jgi:hypothetical protein
MPENHLHIRYDLAVDVQLADGSVMRCRSVEVGTDHIVIKSPYTADKGTRFTLRFSVLIGGKPHEISTPAQAAHSCLVGTENLFHILLRFDKLPPAQHKLLEAFIHERRRD